MENIVGSSLNDTIVGNNGNNRITGGAGNDNLNGGLGVDTVDFLTGGYKVVTVNLATNVATGQCIDIIVNFENVSGSNQNDNIVGNVLNNVLFGNGGNDILNGNAGNDTMIGGLGNDIYCVNAVGDVITEAVNSGIDTVLSSVSYTLGANLERLTLNGTAAINGGGNALANTLVGIAGNNILNGMEAMIPWLAELVRISLSLTRL